MGCSCSLFSTGSIFFLCIPNLNFMTDVKHSTRCFSGQNPVLHQHSRNPFLTKTITETNLLKKFVFHCGFQNIAFEEGFYTPSFIRKHKICCISLACFKINQLPKNFLQLYVAWPCLFVSLQV